MKENEDCFDDYNEEFTSEFKTDSNLSQKEVIPQTLGYTDIKKDSKTGWEIEDIPIEQHDNMNLIFTVNLIMQSPTTTHSKCKAVLYSTENIIGTSN